MVRRRNTGRPRPSTTAGSDGGEWQTSLVRVQPRTRRLRPRMEHLAVRRGECEGAASRVYYVGGSSERLHRRSTSAGQPAEDGLDSRRSGPRRRLGQRRFVRQGDKGLHPRPEAPQEDRQIRQTALQTAQPIGDRAWGLKDWRRVAARYDRCPEMVLSAIMLVATVSFRL